MKILFVGGGNMAQAILGGMAAQKIPSENLCVVEPLAETRVALAKLGVVAVPSLVPHLIKCDAIVLAVKPQFMREAISPLAGILTSQAVISIAAGINTASIAAWLGGLVEGSAYGNVIRAMPNMPALIGAGITGLYAAAGTTAEGRSIAETLLGAVGKTVWFNDEAMLDVVTAISGSGPAYVFYFMEALEQAAFELGFDRDAARMFATQTFVGGVQLAAATSESAGVLRARVTSKRGTTEAAIELFDSLSLKQGFIDGVKAACARSRKLGRELGTTSVVPLTQARSKD